MHRTKREKKAAFIPETYKELNGAQKDNLTMIQDEFIQLKNNFRYFGQSTFFTVIPTHLMRIIMSYNPSSSLGCQEYVPMAEKYIEAREQQGYRITKQISWDQFYPPEYKAFRIILKAHILHNEFLLSQIRHEGCGGIFCLKTPDSDICKICTYKDPQFPRGCRWIYGASRCSCGARGGFSWDTDYVNWFQDITIFSSQYVGIQLRSLT